MIHQNLSPQSGLSSAARMAAPEPVAMAEVLRVLRLSARSLGLSPQVLRSAEVLLSFLPPKRNHHMVFASNETLCARAAGLSERSLRRHIEKLAELGLLERSDSPNRKRYTRFDPLEGEMLRFGLDLSPLFRRLGELTALATLCEATTRRISFLRCQLRAAIARCLLQDPENEIARQAQRLVRRALPESALQDLLSALPRVEVSAATEASVPPAVTATGGQNDRPYQSLNTEHIDKEAELPVEALKAGCPEVLLYTENEIRSEAEVIAHAKNLAPMIGVKPEQMVKAESCQSAYRTAMLIWYLVQRGAEIRNPAAYFQRSVFGPRPVGHKFSPLIAHSAKLSADNSGILRPGQARTSEDIYF